MYKRDAGMRFHGFIYDVRYSGETREKIYRVQRYLPRWLLLRMKRFLQRHLIFRDDATLRPVILRCTSVCNIASLAYSTRGKAREIYPAAGNWRKWFNPSVQFIARAEVEAFRWLKNRVPDESKSGLFVYTLPLKRKLPWKNAERGRIYHEVFLWLYSFESSGCWELLLQRYRTFVSP